MALEGVLTKEFVFEEFKKLETKEQKVKYLKELKETKINHPKMLGIKISLKNIDNLINEWSKPVPFDNMKKEIAEREEREKQLELLKRKD
tara:strand:+ start:161 stop:430 length:270 start_codon:yes stop_codon:yes gene_type:complete